MVNIDKKTCTGCGACASICPEVFEMKDGKSNIKSQEDSDCLQDAIDSCPVNAISR